METQNSTPDHGHHMPEPATLFLMLDQKLETLRGQYHTLNTQVHQLQLQDQTLENSTHQQLNRQMLEMRQMEIRLQELGYQVALELKALENANAQFKREAEARMQDIHFATREELSSLSRRLEVLEKLIL
jgi:hypothetical protein